jgi:hypothetical protein
MSTKTLVTVYRVLYPGLMKVNEYYRWDFDEPIEEVEKTDIRGYKRMAKVKPLCPGCGKELKYAKGIWGAHLCDGHLTDKPLTPNRGSIYYGKPAYRLQEYISAQTHQVTIKE